MVKGVEGVLQGDSWRAQQGQDEEGNGGRINPGCLL